MSEVTVDPSLAAVPSDLVAKYTGMNHRIAEEHTDFSLHIFNSQNAIEETARHALGSLPSGEDRNALILGAGNCFDIPLEEIVDGFDNTTLVDIDTEAIDRAVADLTPRELARVSIIGADLTGIMGKFKSRIDTLRETTSDLRSFVTGAIDIVRDTDPVGQQPDLGRGYGFVCSQLLMSQLGSLPMMTLSAEAQAKYGGTPILAGADEASGDLLTAYTDLNGAMHVEHARHLGRLVRESGAVHFADTYIEALRTPSGTVNAPMVFDAMVKPVVDAAFTDITPRQAWWWNQPSGRQLYVVSHALTPISGAAA